MAEYIEREAFKQKYLCCGYLPEMSEKEFDEFPTADVTPVVRCNDCEHYDFGVCLKIYSDGSVHPAAWHSRKPTDFCSYGIPKNDGGET